MLETDKLTSYRLLAVASISICISQAVENKATCCCRCVHLSVSNMAPHCMCFKPLRPKQQSFMYPNNNLQHAAVFQVMTYANLAALVFQVIQTLQQSFKYPKLAACSLSRNDVSKALVFRVSKPVAVFHIMMYQNLASLVFQVSKPCSSLSHNVVSKPCSRL